MTPQETVKALLRERAGTAKVTVTVRERKGAYYVNLGGDYLVVDRLIRGQFPEAYLTSGGAFDQTFRVAPDEAVAEAVKGLDVDPPWLKWNDATVLRLAQAIDAEQAFARLPILADALEEAGCTNAAFLDHCRARLKHGHACWAVDLILLAGAKRPGRPAGRKR